MRIIGDIYNPEQTALTGYLIKRFMNDSWMRDLLLWIININKDATIVIPWFWEKTTIRINLITFITILGENQTMMVFWDEFLYLPEDKTTPKKFLRKIMRKC